MIQVNHRSGKSKQWLSEITLALAIGMLFLFLNQPAQAIPNGGYAHPEILIQPEELKALIDKKEENIRIIDVRDQLKYLAGHLPGAIHLWRPDITDKNHPLPGMMAPKNQIERLMGNLGIDRKNTLAIYSDGPDNARLWWILAYYGFPIHQMKLLDGGLDGWKAKGYPIEMIPPQVKQAEFILPGKSRLTEHLLCTLPEVKEALNNQKKVVLDVRAEKEYLGEETLKGAARPGRIPGVAFVEWREVLINEGPHRGYWKSSEEIKRLFSNIGVTPDKTIYIY